MLSSKYNCRWINCLTKNLTEILAIFENDKSRVSYNFFYLMQKLVHFKNICLAKIKKRELSGKYPKKFYRVVCWSECSTSIITPLKIKASGTKNMANFMLYPTCPGKCLFWKLQVETILEELINKFLAWFNVIYLDKAGNVFINTLPRTI